LMPRSLVPSHSHVDKFGEPTSAKVDRGAADGGGGGELAATDPR